MKNLIYRIHEAKTFSRWACGFDLELGLCFFLIFKTVKTWYKFKILRTMCFEFCDGEGVVPPTTEVKVEGATTIEVLQKEHLNSCGGWHGLIVLFFSLQLLRKWRKNSCKKCYFWVNCRLITKTKRSMPIIMWDVTRVIF